MNARMFPDADEAHARAALKTIADSTQRAVVESNAMKAQRMRVDAAIKSANESGYECGHREGYILGVNWGMAYGFFGGAITVGCGWALFAPVFSYLSKWVL